jgi:hypothetical protein
VSLKNAILWDVTAYGSCKNRCFRGTYCLHHQGNKNRRARNNVSSNHKPTHAAKLTSVRGARLVNISNNGVYIYIYTGC